MSFSQLATWKPRQCYIENIFLLLAHTLHANFLTIRSDQSVKQYKSGSFVKITSRVILFSDLTFRQWLYTNEHDNKNNVAIDSFKQITQYKECNGASKGHSMQVSAGLRMNDLLSLEMTECPIFGMTSIPWTNLMTGLQWKWNRSFKNPAESMFNVASTWSSSWK